MYSTYSTYLNKSTQTNCSSHSWMRVRQKSFNSLCRVIKNSCNFIFHNYNIGSKCNLCHIMISHHMHGKWFVIYPSVKHVICIMMSSLLFAANTFIFIYSYLLVIIFIVEMTNIIQTFVSQLIASQSLSLQLRAYFRNHFLCQHRLNGHRQLAT